jgi:hypothetical protein
MLKGVKQVVRVTAWLREIPRTLLMDMEGTMQGMPNAMDVTLEEFTRLLSNEADCRDWEGYDV